MKSYSKAVEIPVPAAAQAADANGSHRARLLNSMTSVVIELKKSGGKIDESIYRMPQTATWQDVEPFFKSKLESSGWQKDGTVPAEGMDYRLGVWKNGTSHDKQTIAVALIDAGDVETNFLVVFLAGD